MLSSNFKHPINRVIFENKLPLIQLLSPPSLTPLTTLNLYLSGSHRIYIKKNTYIILCCSYFINISKHKVAFYNMYIKKKESRSISINDYVSFTAYQKLLLKENEDLHTSVA